MFKHTFTQQEMPKTTVLIHSFSFSVLFSISTIQYILKKHLKQASQYGGCDQKAKEARGDHNPYIIINN